MTSIKLQKLVYYCQAWSLVWDEEPLFQEAVEAWAMGPVVHELYLAHRGQFQLDCWLQGDPAKLAPHQIETIDVVLEFYGEKSTQWLVELSHQEKPWKDACGDDAQPGERCENTISHAAMADYYTSLL